MGNEFLYILYRECVGVRALKFIITSGKYREIQHSQANIK